MLAKKEATACSCELGQRPTSPDRRSTDRRATRPMWPRGWRPTPRQIIARYPHARSALLPLLHLVQSEDGYLTPAGIAFCASQLGLTDAEVTAVATFYSMYRRTPTGEYLVGVCTNTLCAIMGGDAILESLEDHLGFTPGRPPTTAGHAGTRRVQRRLRLRPGRDGQLGVLRQPDTVVRPRPRRRPARRRTPGALPRRAAVHVPARPHAPLPACPIPVSRAPPLRRTIRVRRAPPRSPGCGSPRNTA